MKKIFSLVLALVMALSLTTVAFGASVNDVAGLRDAVANATDGDVITLAAGEYDLGSTPLELNKRVTITGTGATIKGSGLADYSIGLITFNAGSEGSVLENVTVKLTATGAQTSAVYFNYGFGETGEETIIRNVTFVGDDTAMGIASTYIGGGDITITDCSLTNFKYGMYFNAVSGLNVYRNTIDTTKYNGIIVAADNPAAPCDDIAINNNTMTNIATANYADPIYSSGISVGSAATDVEASFNAIAVAPGSTNAVAVNGVTNTPSTSASVYDLYAGDDTLYLDNVYRTKVAAKKLTKTQVGQVAGWDIEGTLYVEITKAEATQADFYLTKAGKDDAVLYLRAAENHGVYTLTGKAYDNYNEGDDNCGEWNYDPELVAMYKDDVDGDIYTDLGATAYMLVGKTVVGVALADEANMVDHQMEGVYDAKDKLVGVKCAVCGATGKVYESVAKVPFGADYDFFDGLPYVLNKVAAKPADTETKVESADTFDAGIAMYVGMSVMAAAGAVVLKKRED